MEDKTRQTEAEAKEAERERDRQRRKDKGGALGQRRGHPLRTLETPARLYRGRSPKLRRGSGLCMPPRALNF